MKKVMPAACLLFASRRHLLDDIFSGGTNSLGGVHRREGVNQHHSAESDGERDLGITGDGTGRNNAADRLNHLAAGERLAARLAATLLKGAALATVIEEDGGVHAITTTAKESEGGERRASECVRLGRRLSGMRGEGAAADFRAYMQSGKSR